MTKIWTEAETESLKRAYERGELREQIAERHGRSVNSIRSKVEKMGFVRLTLGRPGRRIRISWSTQDDNRLLELWHNPAFTKADIAQELGKTYEAIGTRASQLNAARRKFVRKKPAPVRIIITPWPDGMRFEDYRKAADEPFSFAKALKVGAMGR